MAFSFIHASDIHLGRPFSDLSEFSYDERIKALYNNAVEQALNKLINFAIEKSVDFIVIAGDTFDSCEQDFKSKLILKEALNRLDRAGIKTYIICGNHDPIYSYNKNTFNFSEDSNIKIIGVNTPIYGRFTIKNRNNTAIAELNALSFEDNHLNENPLKYFEKKENSEIFNIGLLHCDLDNSSSSSYAPCSTSEFKDFNYDYWALGHIHIPDENENIIQYSGTIQGRNTKETGCHGFKYIKVDNNKIIQNSFMPIDIIRFENIDCNLSHANDETQMYNIIENHISDFINNNQNSCELYLVKLILSGCTTFYSSINNEFLETISEKIKNDFNSKVYISKFINNLSPKTDTETLKEDDGISGEIFRTINDDNIYSAISSVENETEFKKLLNLCNLNSEELSNLKEEIKNIAKEECINLASTIYYNETREENQNV